jgi:hypothetical protein
MHGTVKGEHIARLTARSNAQDRAGAETLEGSSCPVHTQVRRTDKAERKLIETLGRRRVRLCRNREARERRQGEIPAKAFAGEP